MPAGLLDLIAAHDVNELRRAVSQRTQRLPPHHRLRAAAANPAAEPSVGRDHRLVAGPRRGGRLGADDSRQRTRDAASLEFADQVEDFVGYSVTPFDRKAAQTLSGPMGMSMLVIPYGDSASMTALT